MRHKGEWIRLFIHQKRNIWVIACCIWYCWRVRWIQLHGSISLTVQVLQVHAIVWQQIKIGWRKPANSIDSGRVRVHTVPALHRKQWYNHRMQLGRVVVVAVHVHLAKFSIRKLAIAMQAEVRLRQKERRNKFRKKKCYVPDILLPEHTQTKQSKTS